MASTFHALANTLHFSPVNYHATDSLLSHFTFVFAPVPVFEVAEMVVQFPNSHLKF